MFYTAQFQHVDFLYMGQVPERAAAAAAVARALAGIPPHERVGLPSSSAELVSIYGSKSSAQAVEELEEEFYKEVSLLSLMIMS